MLTGITWYSVSMEKATNTKYMAMTMAPYVLLSLKFCTKTATSWKQRLKRRKAADTNSTPEKFIWNGSKRGVHLVRRDWYKVRIMLAMWQSGGDWDDCASTAEVTVRLCGTTWAGYEVWSWSRWARCAVGVLEW